jgi:hypothetical protein
VLGERKSRTAKKPIGHLPTPPFQPRAYAALAVRQGANMEDMFGIITLLLIALGIGAVFFWVYRPMR